MNRKGFTLLEILVVLMVLGFLTAMVAGYLSHIKGEAAVVTALNEMKDIKEAIRDRFYPELGLIPEDLGLDDMRGSGDERPEFAIKLLCLKDDAANERADMLVFLTQCGVPSLINWDKYSYKGWRGPYLEREITAYDNKGTPDPADDEWYPIIIDPWGKSVDYSVDPDGVIGEYRIIYDELDTNPGITREDERLSARIVSFGANGVDNGGTTSPLPLPADTGDDLVMFIFGTQPIRRP
ncbi:MAG: type II secretion system protein [bacterium]